MCWSAYCCFSIGAGDSRLRVGVEIFLGAGIGVGVGDAKVRGPGLLFLDPGLIYMGQAVGPWSCWAGGHWKLFPTGVGKKNCSILF